MEIIDNPSSDQWDNILKRPSNSSKEIKTLVKEVFKSVEIEGDKALRKYTSRFDGVKIEEFGISPQDIEKACELVPEELKKAIKTAKNNIHKFHSAQKTENLCVETVQGIICTQEKRSIQKVGLYVPGGTAPLFSTVLMLAIPAQIAGCQQIIMVTPPNPQGNISPEILYTADLCGVKTIFKLGGAQAIAAMTFGTSTIPKVYKIFGPGNQYVTFAKQRSTRYGLSIDMPAGPSELLVIADDSAIPEFVASDLLSQSEHGADSQVLLISTSKVLIHKVKKHIDFQIKSLPRMKLALQSISNSKCIYVDDYQKALEISNYYAPEHLIISTRDNNFFVKRITNAGSVFIGNYTPESAGDYASGTNHTLPTNGYAKNHSGVHVDSFMKTITFQEISKKGLLRIGKTVELMAEAEKLQAHKNAISIRLKHINDESR